MRISLGFWASSPNLRRNIFTTFRSSQPPPAHSLRTPHPLEQQAVGQHVGRLHRQLVEHRPNVALAMLLFATNDTCTYRLATERTVSWRWMLALNAWTRRC